MSRSEFLRLFAECIADGSIEVEAYFDDEELHTKINVYSFFPNKKLIISVDK
jgi:hypothetical protein